MLRRLHRRARHRERPTAPRAGWTEERYDGRKGGRRSPAEMKLACVIHRFGPDIAGGSEAHCRSIAERLAAARHDVTILTTCAARSRHLAERVSGRDVARWPAERAALSGGAPAIAPPVQGDQRTRVQRPRDRGRGRTMVRENGPEVPALIEHLRRQAPRSIACSSGRSAITRATSGCRLSGTRAVLVPTAEADPVTHALASSTGCLPGPRGSCF